MWVFTPIGFFSATLTNPSYTELPPELQHGHIMVRARVREDLERLREIHMDTVLQPLDPEIFALPGHDYPYRIVVTRDSWTTLVAILADRIDYSNFKNAVDKALPGDEGRARHDLYMKVWSVLHGAETWLKRRVADLKARDRDQGSLGFWMSHRAVQSDPRADEDMQAVYDSRGWQEWLEEDEEVAIMAELPEGTHDVIDTDTVIDNPTHEDIARFEAAMARAPRRRRRRGR